MTIAKIHDHGGPKQLTDIQRRVAERLVERGVYVYPEKVQGKGVVAAFRRYLETGDAEKITKPLYRFLTLKAGFIAHFDLHGFRRVYRDPCDLLERKHDAWGSMFSGRVCDGPVDHSQSVYTDGLTDSEVWAQMKEIATELGPMVLERSFELEQERDLALARALAAKHGLTVG